MLRGLRLCRGAHLGGSENNGGAMIVDWLFLVVVFWLGHQLALLM
jgi:hypothetical protein